MLSLPKLKQAHEMKTIQDLPSEVLLKIFDFISHEEASNLRRECRLFERTVSLHMQFALVDLKNLLRQSITRALDYLATAPVSDDNHRLETVKASAMLRYLSNEVDLLFSTVWRYRKHVDAWMTLCPELWPVIEQFERVVSDVTNNFDNGPNLNSFQLKNVLNKWYAFVEKFDSQLEDELTAHGLDIPFEIKVIDLLTCCPSLNSQLALKRHLNEDDRYNVYGYFKLNLLKPVGQTPDVFNSQLNNSQRKKLVVGYIRECVQWQNMTFLWSVVDEITYLESVLSMNFFHFVNPVRILSQLAKKYDEIQKSPYSPVTCFFNVERETQTWNEFYVRRQTFDPHITGFTCVVDIPRVRVEHLPLVVPFWRGMRTSVNEYNATIETNDTPVNLTDFGSHFDVRTSFANHVRTCEKPRLQLVIWYKEAFNSSPTEAVINVSYDQSDQCFFAYDTIRGEAFFADVDRPRLEN